MQVETKWTWFEVEGSGPKWMRRAGIDDKGTVYVPSAAAGGDTEVFICASYDGAPAVLYEDHCYYPADWVKREFPQSKELVEKIERKVRGALG